MSQKEFRCVVCGKPSGDYSYCSEECEFADNPQEREDDE